MTTEINNREDLEAAIKRLEQQTTAQKQQLVDQFHMTYNNLKPVNILKNSINKIVHSPDVVDNIVNTGLSVGLGLLSKRLVVGKSAGVVKKLLGTAMELGVANLVARKSASIKSGGLDLLSKIFKARNRKADVKRSP